MSEGTPTRRKSTPIKPKEATGFVKTEFESDKIVSTTLHDYFWDDGTTIIPGKFKTGRWGVNNTPYICMIGERYLLISSGRISLGPLGNHILCFTYEFEKEEHRNAAFHAVTGKPVVTTKTDGIKGVVKRHKKAVLAKRTRPAFGTNAFCIGDLVKLREDMMGLSKEEPAKVVRMDDGGGIGEEPSIQLKFFAGNSYWAKPEEIILFKPFDEL